MRILFVEADEERERSTSEWICATPARALQQTGKHQARVIHRNQFQSGEFERDWPNLIVVERLLWQPIIERIKECQSHGTKVLCRFDDAYHLLPHYLASHALWRRSIIVGEKDGQLFQAKMDVSMMRQFREGLGICDAASTPSRLLCKDYERYAKKMFYIPNYPDLGNPAWTMPKPKHEGIIIGWGSGGTHRQSFRDSGIKVALQQICHRYNHVKIMLCGHCEWEQQWLREALPEGRLITHPWVTYDKWPTVLAHFDIGLAPLSGTYDDRRSWVKTLDYAIMGIPFVATDSPPYKTVQGGIRVRNKTKNWTRAMKTLLNKQSTYDKLATIGRHFGWQQGIHSHISVYLNIFTEILKG